MRALTPVLAVMLLAACAGAPQRGELRQYLCADGSAFSLEVSDHWVRLRTVTGPIELPRQRHDEHQAFFTNGLRSVVLRDDGSARHRAAQQDWTDCDWSG